MSFNPDRTVVIGDDIFVSEGGSRGIVIAGEAAEQKNVSDFFEPLVIRFIVDDALQF